MIDRRVIVFQIEDMLSRINKENLLTFGGRIDNGSAFLELMTNVLTLLKEQEPIAPGLEQDVDGIYSTCGKCKTKIWKMFGVKFDIKPDALPKFCPNCGQEVKWNA